MRTSLPHKSFEVGVRNLEKFHFYIDFKIMSLSKSHDIAKDT
eukprot:UN23765